MKSNKFLKFLLHDFLDFNMYKNKSLPKNHLFERPIKFTLVNTYYKQYVDKFKLDFFFKMIFYHFYRITICFVI